MLFNLLTSRDRIKLIRETIISQQHRETFLFMNEKHIRPETVKSVMHLPDVSLEGQSVENLCNQND